MILFNKIIYCYKKRKNMEKIKIPEKIKDLFNQEYFDFDLALKIIKSNNSEINKFFSNLMPLVKEFLKKEFPFLSTLIK